MNKKELLECLQYLHEKVTYIIPKDIEVSLAIAIDAVQKDVEAEEKDKDGYKFKVGETVIIDHEMYKGCTGEITFRTKGEADNFYVVENKGYYSEGMLKKL